MGFLDLPLEIIYLITGFLELDNDISALSRTTRQLHAVLDPCLYKNNIKRYNSCALLWAAEHGRVSVAQKMLDAGAPLVQERLQPMFLAAFRGHDAVVRLFLERGLRPDGKAKWWLRGPRPEWNFWNKITENYDRQPVCLNAEEGDPTNGAIREGHASVVHLLHTYGGMAYWDQARVAKAMTTAILANCATVVRFRNERYPETIKYMLQPDRMPPRTTKKVGIARILIEAGALVDTADSQGLTPLNYAVRSGDEDLVRLFVEAGACVNPGLSNGVTLRYIRGTVQIMDIH
ncbi:Ankyrin repeat-containing domain [Penicillium camemberti]|uniref:Ankyrin repeat-containing domain n=1 Tax=Penicillium camemberti (strain FM 013) TaxID=1429867 RepID=A0A0G4PHF9_PENC3|nr:Ankyrin repeat-containing domain [Penicillium camemberti]